MNTNTGRVNDLQGVTRNQERRMTVLEGINDTLFDNAKRAAGRASNG